jgi:hypothetical protein
MRGTVGPGGGAERATGVYRRVGRTDHQDLDAAARRVRGVAGPAAGHVAIDPFQATRFSGCGLQFLGVAGVAGMVEHLAERPEAA